jgi:hypothetical protein
MLPAAKFSMFQNASIGNVTINIYGGSDMADFGFLVYALWFTPQINICF